MKLYSAIVTLAFSLLALVPSSLLALNSEDSSPTLSVTLSPEKKVMRTGELGIVRVSVKSHDSAASVSEALLELRVPQGQKLLSKNPVRVPELRPGELKEFIFFVKQKSRQSGEMRAIVTAKNLGTFADSTKMEVETPGHKDMMPSAKIVLSSDKPITPGAAVTLRASIVSLVPIPDAELEFEFPSGMTATATKLKTGPLAADSPASYEVQVTNQALSGSVKVTLKAPNVGKFWDVLKFGEQPKPVPQPVSLKPVVISPGYVISRPPKDLPSPGMKAPGPSSRSGEPRVDEVGAATPSTALGSLTVRLNLYFFNDAGHWVPVRYATVELYDYDTWSADDLLASGVTDGDGYIEFTVDNNDPESGTQDIYFKIWSSNTAVNVTSGGTDTYLTQSDVEDNKPNGTYTYSWGVNSAQNGAYNVLDALTKAWQFMTLYTSDPVQVMVTWPDEDADGSSEYLDGRVYIEGNQGDADEWDESPIIHEYGHFTMDYKADLGPPWWDYGADDSHQWSSHETNETAWIEGFPNFLQSAVRHYWTVTNPISDNWGDASDYIETTWSVSVESDSHWPGLDMDDVEGAAAAIFWDIFDSNNDAGDTLSMGFNEIWDVIANYDPLPADGSHNHPWTMHEFWDGWFARGHASTSQVWSIFYEHGINKVDSSAPSNPTTVTSSHTAWEWSNDPTIAFTWSGASDNLSGVAGYSYSTTTSSSSVPDTVVDTTGSSYTTGSLAQGSSGYYFHLRTKDNAGNWNSAAVHKGPYYIDTTAPSTGTLSINSGSAYTNTSSVSLTLSSSDALSGLCSMAIWNEGGMFALLESYAASKSWTINSGEGAHTVTAYYYDCAGNVSSGTSDTIILDSVPPGTPVISGTTPTTDTTPTWSWVSGGGGAGVYYCLLDGVSGFWCSSPYSPVTALSVGTHTLSVWEQDAAGNWSSYGSHSINIQNALTVSVSPPGSGTVMGEGMLCPGDCESGHDSGATASLTAVGNSTYQFSSWSGCTSASGPNCTVTMSSSKSVTANFTACALNPVWIMSSSALDSTIQLGYNSAAARDTVQLQAVQFTENVVFSGAKAITLLGGYNCAHAAVVGKTALKGTLTLSLGSVVVSDLILL